MARLLLRLICNVVSAAVGLVLVLPWLALSVVGLALSIAGMAFLGVADAIERFKDAVQDELDLSSIPPPRRSRTYGSQK